MQRGCSRSMYTFFFVSIAAAAYVLYQIHQAVGDDFEQACLVQRSWSQLLSWWIALYLGPPGACTTIRNKRSDRYLEFQAAQSSVHRFAASEPRGVDISLTHHGLPRISAASVSASGGVERLMAAIAAARFHAVVITDAFAVRTPLHALTVMAGARRYTANNGRFASQHACNQTSMAPRRASLVSLDDLFGSGAPNPSDMHIFHAVPHGKLAGPRRAKGRDKAAAQQCQKSAFEPGSVESLLLDATVLQGNGTQVSRQLSRLLRRGRRRIFTAMRAAMSIQFHDHEATWFALTHGRKAWWLGAQDSAPMWRALGSGRHLFSACEYLHLPRNRPDPDLGFLVQEAGEIIIFGEGVAHATCALEDSLGVGIQMGFSESPFITESEQLRCRPLREGETRRAPDAEKRRASSSQKRRAPLRIDAVQKACIDVRLEASRRHLLSTTAAPE